MKSYLTFYNSVLDIIPHLYTIISAKDSLKQVVDIHIEYGLNYKTQLTLDGHYKTTLEPDIELLLLNKRQTLEDRKNISKEIQYEKIRRSSKISNSALVRNNSFLLIFSSKIICQLLQQRRNNQMKFSSNTMKDLVMELEDLQR